MSTMKKINMNMLMKERMDEISENKKRISIRKLLDNWFMLVVVCLGFYTAKIAADQAAMYFKFKLIENQRER